MTVDNSKLNYYSAWDIDQLIATDTVLVGLGDTAIFTITGQITVPEFQVQFKPISSTYWYEMGTSSTDGTVGNTFTAWSYISGSSVFMHAPSAGTARYFVWGDKVDY